MEERIGEYLVRRQIGEGGMGKVFEAEERLSKRRVALKVLKSELARSEDGRRLFLNEMTILAHLDHPNVVRCLACTEVDGELVMVLEYLEGRTLREVLAERGKLPWDEAVGVAVQIAAALAAAHRQEPPIVHRDLKPENVMVLRDGSVKVMDFGIAKVLQALSRSTTQSVGTLQYMSPEQIDAGLIDGRSDLYSLGLVLYELLQGRPPFESASPRELLNLQCTADPPPLDEEVRRGLPRGVERLLAELLEKRADDRPATAEDVLHELEPFAPSAGAVKLGGARRNDGPVTEPMSLAHPAMTPRLEPERVSKAPSPARRAAASGVGTSETVALIEKATAPREVPAFVALAVVVALSLTAAIGAAVLKRLVARPGPPQPAVTATADPRP